MARKLQEKLYSFIQNVTLNCLQFFFNYIYPCKQVKILIFYQNHFIRYDTVEIAKN